MFMSNPFSFYVKDFQTGIPIMRCNSSGVLYPITSQPQHSSSSHYSFAAISNALWSNRFGHPNSSILRTLYHHNLISCSKLRDNFIFHSCTFWKQTKLSFFISLNSTVLPFDIIHSNT